MQFETLNSGGACGPARNLYPTVHTASRTCLALPAVLKGGPGPLRRKLTQLTHVPTQARPCPCLRPLHHTACRSEQRRACTELGSNPLVAPTVTVPPHITPTASGAKPCNRPHSVPPLLGAQRNQPQAAPQAPTRLHCKPAMHSQGTKPCRYRRAQYVPAHTGAPRSSHTRHLKSPPASPARPRTS